jgi:hypothetical protein
MTTEAQREQQERRETLENDRRVREQQSRGSTYLDHHHSELGGRFGSIETETITGRPSPLSCRRCRRHRPGLALTWCRPSRL